MLDIKLLRQDSATIEKKLQTKDPEISLQEILQLDQNVREMISKEQHLQSQRNTLSKEIGKKKQQKLSCEDLVKEVHDINEQIQRLDKQKKEKETLLQQKLAALPNVPQDDIPISLDPKDNVCIKSYKEKPTFSFPVKNHLELNEKLHLFDFSRSAKITGSGWPCYTNLGAQIEWALLNYMLDVHKKNGFTFILPPLLVRENIMYGAGQFPKFRNQIFELHDDEYPLFLLPTSEVALCGLHADEVLAEEKLPLKYVSYTPCFRREAGALGKQERGLIRMHQFNKVEIFCFTKPSESNQIFEQMIASAEEVLQGLDLHYRNMLLVTGDMSFASSRTVDIEVYLPGQNRYYEVSSVSNCTDYQARRNNIRFKEDNKLHFVHALNGSGVATARLMVALLENNQREDGSIEIPQILHKYLEKEITKIQPDNTGA